ncbi:hypothetical protein HPT27_18875 [Permianibacter sp. IMCC34836]|uniref:hypothetical protein n=1 Tax=Permianibacter fluminis TaxID=2738515 RepID=UPI001556CD70|nr:hypothetical protein [Permianibacter fluminis]NQD39086.1 hypothetical protein [Permianibacter fluminis]
MNKRLVIITLAAAGLIGLATVWLARESASVPPAATVATVTESRNAGSEPGPGSLREHPLVRAYEAYTDFQQHSRGFFDHADQLSEQEKQAQLRQLMDGTNKYEQEGKLVPMEALVLKLAMLRYSSSGDDDYKTKAKTLIDQYKAISDAREQAWLANPDPKFIDYKRQENDIVNEVLAMTVIPDGLSRDEYLRQRLEQARIATMGAGATGP